MNTVIITGVGGGLGRVSAKHFLESGWNVIGTGIGARPEGLDEKIDYHDFDASDSAACVQFWQEVQGSLEAGTCLYNCAGGYVGGGVLDTSTEDYVKQVQSNYFAAVHMTRGFAGALKQGRIINIVSANALAVNGHDPAYGASKAAEKYFFQTMQQEFKPTHYRITNIYPDSIATRGPNPEAIDPEDLASLVVQVAENAASYVMQDITLKSVGTK